MCHALLRFGVQEDKRSMTFLKQFYFILFFILFAHKSKVISLFLNISSFYFIDMLVAQPLYMNIFP